MSMVINIWICKLLFCQQFYYIRAKHKNEPWEKLLFYFSTENKYKLFRLSFLTSVLRCKFRLYSFVLMYTYRFTLSLKVDTINTENSFSHSTGKRLKKTKIVNWLLLLNTTTDWVKKVIFVKLLYVERMCIYQGKEPRKISSPTCEKWKIYGKI